VAAAEPTTGSLPTAGSNPHRMGKQATGVAVAAAVVFLIVKLGGLAVILAGVFTFLDAWHAGIYKQPDSKSFVNLSPMGWSIAMMGVLIITYPFYVANRGKLKTRDCTPVFWVLTNLFGVISLALIVLAFIVGPAAH
jgi:hypothetical protein